VTTFGAQPGCNSTPGLAPQAGPRRASV
jgi:hypothetical protein